MATTIILRETTTVREVEIRDDEEPAEGKVVRILKLLAGPRKEARPARRVIDVTPMAVEGTR